MGKTVLCQKIDWSVTKDTKFFGGPVRLFRRLKSSLDGTPVSLSHILNFFFAWDPCELVSQVNEF